MSKKKSQISIQTFFFILMIIMMIWIIYFGVSKIFLVNNTISDQQRISVIDNLKQAFTYCSDPLNKGSFKTVEIKSNQINGICFLGSDIEKSTNPYNRFLQLQTLYNSTDNIAIINANLVGKKIQNLEVIDKLKVERNFTSTSCQLRNGSQNLEIKINC